MKLMDEVMLQEKRMIADRRYLHKTQNLVIRNIIQQNLSGNGYRSLV